MVLKYTSLVSRWLVFILSVQISAEIANERYDVVIVGGGLSGLSAAYRLLENNPHLKIAIYEASDRIGGRVAAEVITNTTIRFDIGATWVHHSQKLMNRLVQELGLKMYAQPLLTDPIVDIPATNSDLVNVPVAGRFAGSLFDHSFPVLMSTKYPYFVHKKPAMVADQEPMSVHDFAMKFYSNESAIVDAYDLGINLITEAESKDVSFLFALVYYATMGNMRKPYRIFGNNVKLINTLVQYIGRNRIFTKRAVTVIDYQSPLVKIKVNSRIVEAKNVIMAIPPNQVVEGVRFRPQLRPEKVRLLKHFRSGSIFWRVVLAFSIPFWKKGSKSTGMLLVRPNMTEYDTNNDSTEPQMKAYFEDASSKSTFVLVGLAEKKHMKDLPLNIRKDKVLEVLVKYYGAVARDTFLGYTDKDWMEEKYIKGCVARIPPNNLRVLERLEDNLRAPTDNIYWAGTETANQWIGFMEGAVQAGFRAADEILASLHHETTTGKVCPKITFFIVLKSLNFMLENQLY